MFWTTNSRTALAWNCSTGSKDFNLNNGANPLTIAPERQRHEAQLADAGHGEQEYPLLGLNEQVHHHFDNKHESGEEMEHAGVAMKLNVVAAPLQRAA